MTPSREIDPNPRYTPYRRPSPPPSDPPEPKVPAKTRAKKWFKDNADSRTAKLIATTAIMTLFVAVGLSITAIEPITSHGVEAGFAARLALSVLVGFTVCLTFAMIVGFCYMLGEMLGDLLKGIARRL